MHPNPYSKKLVKLAGMTDKNLPSLINLTILDQNFLRVPYFCIPVPGSFIFDFLRRFFQRIKCYR